MAKRIVRTGTCLGCERVIGILSRGLCRKCYENKTIRESHGRPASEGFRNRPQCGGNVVDRTGQRYGRLVVLRREGSRKTGPNGTTATWLCRCDCGTEKVILGSNLRGKGGCGTISCGCANHQRKKRGPYKRRLPPGEASRRTLFSQYQRAAKARGLSWDLSKGLFDLLIESECRYCGIKPHRLKTTKFHADLLYNGIDRVVNSVGYLPINVVPCCYTCNHAKAQMGVDEFLAWIARVFRHSIGQNHGVESSVVTSSRVAPLL